MCDGVRVRELNILMILAVCWCNIQHTRTNTQAVCYSGTIVQHTRTHTIHPIWFGCVKRQWFAARERPVTLVFTLTWSCLACAHAMLCITFVTTIQLKYCAARYVHRCACFATTVLCVCVCVLNIYFIFLPVVNMDDMPNLGSGTTVQMMKICTTKQ